MATSSQVERSRDAIHAAAIGDCQPVTLQTSRVGLDRKPDLRSVSPVEELSRRPSRPADYAAENRALIGLMQQLSASPRALLQELANAALTLCRAHSAGLSLLDDQDPKRGFQWGAVAGRWAAHAGGDAPRDFGPCGTVLDRNEPLLFSHPERDFPRLAQARPHIDEGLLVPFAVCGEPIGAIWAVAHDASCRFDAEDLRVMRNLGAFASSAYGTLLSLEAARAAERRAEEAAAASRLLAAIVSSAGDAIASRDLDGRILSWNKAAERLFGYAAEEIVGRSIDLLLPAGYADEEAEILERVRRGERVDDHETVRRRKDGSLIDVALSAAALADGAGRLIGASTIARDISERRLAREQQDLLLRDMNHRVKNLFAVAGSLMALSARSARSPRDLACSVRDRFAALARAHDLLPAVGTMGGTSEATTLHALIRTVFAPYTDRGRRGRERLLLCGPDVPVGSTALINVTLLFHELTTNAAKYGALTARGGAVQIDCAVRQAEVMLTWTERGGPPLAGAPDHAGFGFDFMRQVTKLALCGQIAHEWTRDGLIVRLSMPVAVLAG